MFVLDHVTRLPNIWSDDILKLMRICFKGVRITNLRTNVIRWIVLSCSRYSTCHITSDILLLVFFKIYLIGFKLPNTVVWMAWNFYLNCGQMWVIKRTKTMSIHVQTLDFIALNDCFWFNWHRWGEKMFKTEHFVKVVLGPEFLVPTNMGSVGAPKHHWSNIALKGWIILSWTACLRIYLC